MADREDGPRRGLRVPLPEYLLDQLESHEQAWILSAMDRVEAMDQPLVLINEKMKPEDEILAWGVVEIFERDKFKDGAAAIGVLSDSLDEVTRREYAGRNPSPTYGYRLRLVECYNEPRDVEARGRRIPSVKASDIAFVATLTPEQVDGMSDAELTKTACALADVWDERFGDGDEDAGGLNREEVLAAGALVAQRALERNMELDDRYLWSVFESLNKSSFYDEENFYDDEAVEKFEQGAYKPFKGFFTAHGTLFRFRNIILPHVPPDSSFDTFVELTAGPGQLLWWRPQTCKEIVNDIDARICRLYRVCQGLSDAQMKQLERKDWTLRKKKFYQLLKDQEPDDDIEFIYRQLYLRTACRASIDEPAGMNKTLEGHTMNPLKYIHLAHDRLRGVKITNLDFTAAIKRFDSPQTLFFVDPPYPDRFHRLYNHGDDDLFSRIGDELPKINGKFILVTTGDDKSLAPLVQHAGLRRHRFQWTQPMANINPYARPWKPAEVITNYTKKSLIKSDGVPNVIFCEGQAKEFNQKLAKYFSEDLTRFPVWTYFARMNDGEPIAGLLATRVPFGLHVRSESVDIPREWITNGAAWQFRKVVVVPQFRGNRLGTKLLNAAIEALPKSVKFVELVSQIAIRNKFLEGSPFELRRFGPPPQQTVVRDLGFRANMSDDQISARYSSLTSKQKKQLGGVIRGDFSSEKIKYALAKGCVYGFWVRNSAKSRANVKPVAKADEMFTVPKTAGNAAVRALEWRREFGRGGTDVGVRRATQLKNGERLSADTVKRMWSYFRRHEVDRKAEGFNEGEKGFPSAGRIAWDLWGGDAAYEWLKKLRQSDKWPVEKSGLAPVHPGSEGLNEQIRLREVVKHVRPIVLRQDAVVLVGSLPQWERTGGDVDVLIKGPLDEATRRAVQFRVGRQFPPELSQRLQFLDDDMGGPFTTNLPLYHLALLPVTHEMSMREDARFERVVMDAEPVDKADVYAMYPANPNRSVRSVIQLEFQGRGFHVDWRIATRASQLVGWTITAMRAGKISDDVTSISEARQYAAGLTMDGNAVTKPFTGEGGRGLLAIQKRPAPPPEWLEIDERMWDEETKTGKTKHVMISVDRPMVGFGFLDPYFCEYFLTRGSKFNGTVFIRQLAGGGGTQEEEEAGRATPEGQAFWRFFVSPTHLPSVLRRRAVREGKMPPNGVSALPRDLQLIVPAQYRYWEKRGSEAKAARDALVESRFLTEDNVKVVGGRYVRVAEREKYYSLPPARKAETSEGEYRLLWQYWKRRAESAREGPSRQVWHLLVKAGKKYAWSFQQDPFANDRTSGVSGVQADDDWKQDGEVAPGTTGGVVENDTKATPSWAVEKDAGKARVIEEDGAVVLDVDTKDGRKVLRVRQEEPGAKIWISERRSEKAVELSALPDDATVVFKRHGPEALECGDCGSLGFSRSGDALRCAKCGAPVDAPGARYVWEIKESGADIGAVPVVPIEAAAAVPTRDGVQIWDPDKVDERLDRKQLRPLALFQVMKPRDSNAFTSDEELVERWQSASPGEVFVEPKLNGRTIVAERDDSGRVMLFFDDSPRDKSHVLPTLTKALKGAKGGAFVVVGELMDYGDNGKPLPRRTLARFGQDTPQDDGCVRITAFRALYTDGQNRTAEHEGPQRSALKRWVDGVGSDRVELVERRRAGSARELREAIRWASKQPGSEGAMVKDDTATYSLGGHTSSWWKVKTTRAVRAIVLGKTRKRPSPQQRGPSETWVYECGLGPIASGDEWKETREHDGKTYVYVGKTGATNVAAKPGDTVEVDVLELLYKAKEPRTLHWFGPPVVSDKSTAGPMSPKDVVDLLRPDEVEKATRGGRIVPVGKGDEFEGYFLAVVLKPNDGVDGPLEPDTQNDVYSSAEIDYAMRWNAEHDHGGNIQHAMPADEDYAFVVVQNFKAPVDYWLGPTGESVSEPNDWRDTTIEPPGEGYEFIPAGTWMREGKAVGRKLKDGLRTGEFTSWSIEGTAVKTPEKVRVER